MVMAEQTTPLGECVSRIEGGYEHLATKADLARVETDIAQLRADFKAEIAGLDGKVAGLDGKVEALRGEVRGIKWWIVSIGAAAVALSSLAQLLPLGGLNP